MVNQFFGQARTWQLAHAWFVGTWPFLAKSHKKPTISGSLGSLGGLLEMPQDGFLYGQNLTFGRLISYTRLRTNPGGNVGLCIRWLHTWWMPFKLTPHRRHNCLAPSIDTFIRQLILFIVHGLHRASMRRDGLPAAGMPYLAGSPQTAFCFICTTL